MLASAISRLAGALRGLESRRLLGSSGGIASAIRVGPGSGKLAALHDQVFTGPLLRFYTPVAGCDMPDG